MGKSWSHALRVLWGLGVIAVACTPASFEFVSPGAERDDATDSGADALSRPDASPTASDGGGPTTSSTRCATIDHATELVNATGDGKTTFAFSDGGVVEVDVPMDGTAMRYVFSDLGDLPDVQWLEWSIWLSVDEFAQQDGEVVVASVGWTPLQVGGSQYATSLVVRRTQDLSKITVRPRWEHYGSKVETKDGPAPVIQPGWHQITVRLVLPSGADAGLPEGLTLILDGDNSTDPIRPDASPTNIALDGTRLAWGAVHPNLGYATLKFRLHSFCVTHPVP